MGSKGRVAGWRSHIGSNGRYPSLLARSHLGKDSREPSSESKSESEGTSGRFCICAPVVVVEHSLNVRGGEG